MRTRKPIQYEDLDGGTRTMERVKNGVYITLTPDELEKLNDVCQYLGISRGMLLSITVENIYERHLMNNTDITADEIAEKFGIGWGVVSDITGIF